MEVGYEGILENGQMSEGAVPRPHAQVHLLSPTDKCKVCNEPAAKHVHYGAMTCFSCRAFFRRSIQNKTASTYVCRRSRNCEIKLSTRKNCQYCRYAKCLEAGMKPSWVLSEDERQRRFKKNRERGQDSGSSSGVSPPPHVLVQQEQSQASHSRHRSEKTHQRVIQSRPFPGAATLEDARLMTSFIEQQQQQLQQQQQQQQAAVLIKKEPVSSSGVEINVSGLSVASSLGAVKSEAGFILTSAPSSAQTILLYTGPGSPPAPHPAVIVSSGQPVAPVQVRLPVSSSPSVTITPSQPPLVTDEKTKNISSSVIVQTPGARSEDAGHAGADQVAPFNLSMGASRERKIVEAASVSSLADAILVNTATSAPRQQQQQQQQATAAIKVRQMTGNNTEIIQEVDWDSNYEDDVFSSDEEPVSDQIKKSEPEIKFCQDEWYQINTLVKAHNDKYRSVNFGEELIKEMIMCSMFGIPVSTSAAISGYRLTVERITRIAHNLECFTELSKNDQSQLLMENADLLVNLRGAIFFDSKKKGVNQILISMGIEDMDMIKSIYTPLLKENSMKHIDYKTFNSIQTVENNGVEKRYGELQHRVASLLSSDDIITVLTTYIILFSVDFCDLNNKQRVEQTQEFFIRMLQRYIYSQSPRKLARLRLANSLEMITCLREMADIKKMRKINVNVKVP